MRRYTLAALAGFALPATAAAGQDLAGFADYRWQPREPSQGTMIYLFVRPNIEDVDAVTGSLAGQSLHFERHESGEFWAIGPVPVTASETLLFTFGVVQAADTSHRNVRIPIEPGEYRSTRLSVSSRFTTPPDSALSARIARENALSARVSRNTHGRERQWEGEWIPPRSSPITSEFGVQRMFNGQLRSRHMGVDYDGETGDPIYAANRGVVALVGSFYYAGNVVYLDHGRGLITIYMHMSAVDVEEGQVVERGQLLGRVGATGRVTGPHVHWTARYGRISVDGTSLIQLGPPEFFPPPTSR